VLQPYLGHGQQAGICLAFLDAPGEDAQELPGVPVCIANAGMVAPVLRTAAGVQLLEVGGMPLGSPLAGVRAYQELTIHLQPGDMLILSSDGIVEAMNTRGELYGFERLWEIVAAGPDNAEGMLAALMQDISAFAGEAELHDDIVAMVVVARE
jgi:sigma-B regulation protein RsbU (phosphoserine phosphatase)